VSARVLITGGAGFLGLHLAKHLWKDGCDLCLVDNLTRGVDDPEFNQFLSNKRTTFIEADLLSIDQTISLGVDFDFIFHLAAIVGVRHVQDQPYNVLVKNTRMLENVITLARMQKREPRLLFASTSEVYAGTLEHFGLTIPTSESAPLALTGLHLPRSSYMLSKLMGEAMVKQSGLPFTIFRPHNLYGSRMGNVHVIPEQLRKAYETDAGGSVVVYSPEHTRAFCFIDDSVEMLQRMMLREGCAGRTLNLGSQTPEVTMRHVAEICIEVSGKELLIEEFAPTPGSPPRRAPDMTLTNDLLDYQAAVGLRSGIEQTWEWYCSNVFESGGISAE